jgi:hypothetical protein
MYPFLCEQNVVLFEFYVKYKLYWVSADQNEIALRTSSVGPTLNFIENFQVVLETLGVAGKCLALLLYIQEIPGLNLSQLAILT